MYIAEYILILNFYLFFICCYDCEPQKKKKTLSVMISHIQFVIIMCKMFLLYNNNIILM